MRISDWSSDVCSSDLVCIGCEHGTIMQDTGGAIGFEQGASEKSQCLVRRIRHDHKRMLVVAFDPVHQRLAPFLDCFIEEQGRQLWRSRFRPAPPAFGKGNNSVPASAKSEERRVGKE